MTDPVLMEVTRGQVVESRHRGAVAVVNASGNLLYSLGDVDRAVFPRSAVKAFQALPLIESGAADRFGFGAAELAVAMASHNGETRHVDVVRGMLARAGRTEVCLECGVQWPERGKDQARLHRMGATAARIHNNCSGKHAGFVCAAVAMDVDPAGYVRPDHPLMREVVATMEAMTGAPHDVSMRGTDGCSIPTFAIPLRAIARGFALFSNGEGLAPVRAAAAARLRRAAAEEPFMVAGTGRFCSEAMSALGERAFLKVGAEGVYIAAIPSRGLGVALKIEDGAARAAEAAMGALLPALVGLAVDDPAGPVIRRLGNPRILSRNGEPCGEIRASAELRAFADRLAA